MTIFAVCAIIYTLKEVFMVGIIGAMEIETKGLIDNMKDVRNVNIGAYAFTTGTLRGKPVVVCRCGIGKVFSSTAAALMLSEFEVNTIISIGVAGGKKPIKQGDIVIAERTVQHDYDATADGLELGCVHGFDSPYFICSRALVGQLSEVISHLGFDYSVGTIATGDCFVSSREKSDAIASRFNAIAFDMESAAINQVCAYQGVSFVSMRAISDNGDDEAIHSFYEFVTVAAARSIEVISEFVARFG